MLKILTIANKEANKMLGNEKGFTLIELLIAVTIIGIVVLEVIGIGCICRGNFWYSETGVLRELQINNPNITKIKTERNILYRSIVIAVDKEGKVIKYLLDTNFLFNYDLEEQQ